MHVGRSRNMPYPARNSLCDFVVSLQVSSYHLHINGRWNSEIQNLRNDVGGLEKELHSRKMLRQEFAKLPRQIRCRRMFFRVQRDQNLRIAAPDCSARTI